MALQLTDAQARAAIQMLRDGLPPEPRVSQWMTCGLRDHITEAGRTLLRVASGGYQVALVAGSNGAGKSHLLYLFQLLAEEQGFLVSYSSQDIATGVVLNRPDLVYQAVVGNLTPQKDRADPLLSLLEDWAERAIPQLESAAMNMGQFYRLRDAGLLPGSSPRRTTLCLLLYVWGARQSSAEACRLALGGLRGEQIANRSLCEAAQKLTLDPGYVSWTPNAYDSEFWFGQLKTVIFMATATGRPGALIVLDEIESLLELGRSSSKGRAYREMTALFRNVYGLARTWLVLAYTPAFLVGLERDLVADDNFRGALSVVRKQAGIELPARLEPGDAECVVKHVREIYAIARKTTLRLGDPAQLVQRWIRTGGATRELVRMSVEECDRAGARSR